MTFYGLVIRTVHWGIYPVCRKRKERCESVLGTSVFRKENPMTEPYRSTTQAFEGALEPPRVDTRAEPMRAATHLAGNLLEQPLAQAVLTSLIVFGALMILNPPLVQEKSTSKVERPKRSMGRIVGLSILAGVLVILIPWGVRLMNKRSS